MGALAEGVDLGRVVPERRVRVRLRQRAVDGRGVEHPAVAVGGRAQRRPAPALVPEREEPRAAVGPDEVGVGDVEAPVQHPDDDAASGPRPRRRGSRVRARGAAVVHAGPSGPRSVVHDDVVGQVVVRALEAQDVGVLPDLGDGVDVHSSRDDRARTHHHLQAGDLDLRPAEACDDAHTPRRRLPAAAPTPRGAAAAGAGRGRRPW